MKKTSQAVTVTKVTPPAEITPSQAILKAHDDALMAEFEALDILPIYDKQVSPSRFAGIGWQGRKLVGYSVSHSGVAVEEISMEESARRMAVIHEAALLADDDTGSFQTAGTVRWLQVVSTGSF